MFCDIHRQEVKFGHLTMLNNNMLWLVVLFNYCLRLLIRRRRLKVKFRFIMLFNNLFLVISRLGLKMLLRFLMV